MRERNMLLIQRFKLTWRHSWIEPTILAFLGGAAGMRLSDLLENGFLFGLDALCLASLVVIGLVFSVAFQIAGRPVNSFDTATDVNANDENRYKNTASLLCEPPNLEVTIHYVFGEFPSRRIDGFFVGGEGAQPLCLIGYVVGDSGIVLRFNSRVDSDLVHDIQKIKSVKVVEVAGLAKRVYEAQMNVPAVMQLNWK